MDLIKNTNSKFIMISYNSKGIIPLEEMDEILQAKGKVEKIPCLLYTSPSPRDQA